MNKHLILGTLLICVLYSETLLAQSAPEPEYDGLLEMYLRIEADNNPNGYARKRLRLYKEPDTCLVFRETYSHTDTLRNITPPIPGLPNVNAGASIGATLNPDGSVLHIWEWRVG